MRGMGYGQPPIGGLANLQTSEFLLTNQGATLYYRNLFEIAPAANILITNENASYPKYRLYDRNIGLKFKGSVAASPFVILCFFNPGQSEGADTLIIGPNHNLSGKTMRLVYSDDGGSSYFHIIGWAAYEGPMLIRFPYQVHFVWRIEIYELNVPPEITEIFLTTGIALQQHPIYGSDRGIEENVSRIESRSGSVQKTVLGQAKRARQFKFTKISDNQKNELEAFQAGSCGKNIWFEDLEGEFFFAEIVGGLGRFQYEEVRRWGLTINVLEVLP